MVGFRLFRALFLLSLLILPGVTYAGEITIGVIAGLTRLGSTYGEGIVQGARMAVDEINAEGGINGNTVTLKIVDDASDPARSAIAMRRLVSANVDMIVGGWGSSQVFANLPVAEHAGIPYIVVGATNPRITSAQNMWTFRVIQSDSKLASQLADIATEKLKLKRIAVMSATNAYGIGNREEFLKRLSHNGLVPVQVETFTASDRVFKNQLQNIKNANPDGVAVFGTIPAAPLIIKQARELGIQARFLGTGGLANEKLIELAPVASEGTVLMGLFNENSDPEAQAWSNRFKERYKNETNASHPVLAAWEYRAIRYIAAPCLKDDHKKRKAVRDCIKNWKGELFGLTGTAFFNASGQLEQSPVVIEVRDGSFQYFRD